MLRKAILAVLMVTALMGFPESVSAQQIDFLRDSPAWLTCGGSTTSGLDTFFFTTMPCISKNDPAAAQKVIDYFVSPDGARALQNAAEKVANGNLDHSLLIYTRWNESMKSDIDIISRQMRQSQQKQIVAELIAAPKAPITLLSCAEAHDVDHPQWQIDASWKSNTKIATAIKLRVQTENAFGDVLQTDDLAPTGTYGPDASTSDAWTIGDLHMPATANVSKVRCEIIAAIFQDGTVWNAPPIASPAPSPLHRPKKGSQ